VGLGHKKTKIKRVPKKKEGGIDCLTRLSAHDRVVVGQSACLGVEKA